MRAFEGTLSPIVIEPSRGRWRLDLGAAWPYRELLYFLVWRDVKVRYKQAALGVGWVVLTPVLTVLVFSMVFGVLARLPSDGHPYVAFAFAGFLPWSYFSQALARGAMCLVGSSQLLTKVYFPRILIPVAAVTMPAVDLLFSSIAMGGLLVWYGIVPGWGLALLPVFTLYAGITALALALWLSPVNVRFRDVGHTIPFLIQCWMYLSPVVYPLSLVPDRWQIVYGLNPMVAVVEGFRWGLLGASSPRVSLFLPGAAVVLVLLVTGTVFFKRMERSLADVV